MSFLSQLSSYDASAERYSRLVVQHSLFPILQIYLPSLSESERVDAVIYTIRQSVDFAQLTPMKMAEYWAEGVEPRIWEAINVFVPPWKTAAADWWGRRLRDQEEYE